MNIHTIRRSFDFVNTLSRSSRTATKPFSSIHSRHIDPKYDIASSTSALVRISECRIIDLGTYKLIEYIINLFALGTLGSDGTLVSNVCGTSTNCVIRRHYSSYLLRQQHHAPPASLRDRSVHSFPCTADTETEIRIKLYQSPSEHECDPLKVLISFVNTHKPDNRASLKFSIDALEIKYVFGFA